MSSNEVFSNPQPPSNYSHPSNSRNDSQPMTNDDFRKLLMTPSVGNSSSILNREKSLSSKGDSSASKKKFANEASEKRKEKKLFYASLVKEAKEREAELAKKYRDRAKERREQDKTVESDFVSTTSNYKAIGPGGFTIMDNADRRRQIIEESKYLGGDLEHTHLVKGLDYALLQKIKAESENKNKNDEEDEDERDQDEDEDKEDDEKQKEENTKLDAIDENYDEKTKPNSKPKILMKQNTAALAIALNKSLLSGGTQAPLKKQLELGKNAQQNQANKTKKIVEQIEDNDDENKLIFKNKLSRNIYRVLFETKTNMPKINELFAPHRMAYIVDLNDEETDVPITSIRSKVDCPNNENNTILTTNDIVINKLTQILSYLRHGKRDAKKIKKKNNNQINEATKAVEVGASLGIYDDIDDYIPDLSKKTLDKTESNLAKKIDYFGKSKFEDEPISLAPPSEETANQFIKNINEKYSKKEIETKKEEKKADIGFKFDQDSYAECYPGTRAEEDVNIDSDEEVDFSKMDTGSKKGPVNRWDFDTNEEFDNYMSNREALPKAAFQFGLKMNDGRKTRRLAGDNKNEKAKLDKEWSQISKIIDKRKQGDFGSLGKKAKY